MKIEIRRNIIAKACVWLTLVVFCVGQLSAGVIQVPVDTEVKLSPAPGTVITSKTVKAGDEILMVLTEPLEIGGKVIIEKGARATATVAEAQKAKTPGKKGILKIEYTELEPEGDYRLMEGDVIKLAGEATFEGSGKALLSYIFIFGLFIKGSNGKVATDTVLTAKTAETVILTDE